MALNVSTIDVNINFSRAIIKPFIGILTTANAVVSKLRCRINKASDILYGAMFK